MPSATISLPCLASVRISAHFARASLSDRLPCRATCTLSTPATPGEMITRIARTVASVALAYLESFATLGILRVFVGARLCKPVDIALMHHANHLWSACCQVSAAEILHQHGYTWIIHSLIRQLLLQSLQALLRFHQPPSKLIAWLSATLYIFVHFYPALSARSYLMAMVVERRRNCGDGTISGGDGRRAADAGWMRPTRRAASRGRPVLSRRQSGQVRGAPSLQPAAGEKSRGGGIVRAIWPLAASPTPGRSTCGRHRRPVGFTEAGAGQHLGSARARQGRAEYR